MAFNLEDLSPEQQDFVRQALEDERSSFGPMLPTPSMIGRSLEALNTFTNKIPVLNNFTDQFDYEPGGFQRFKERAAEQPLENTAREVFDFARGRMTDLPVLGGAVRTLPALVGRGLSTAAGTTTLGTRALGAVGNLARSHPMIASLLAGMGLNSIAGDSGQGSQGPEQTPSAEATTPEDTSRLQELLSQTSRKDEILNAIRNGGMISVGKDDNLAEMGIGKGFSKTPYKPARTKEMAGREDMLLKKIDSEIIPKFEEDALKIEDNLRKALAKGERDAPTVAGAEGVKAQMKGPELDAYVRRESRRLAFSMVPPSLRGYIPSSYVEGA